MKKVLGKRILCEIPKKKESNIITPDSMKSDDSVEVLDSHIFTVAMVGTDVEHISVGDKVHLLPRQKNIYKVDGMLVLSEDEIVLVEKTDEAA